MAQLFFPQGPERCDVFPLSDVDGSYVLSADSANPVRKVGGDDELVVRPLLLPTNWATGVAWVLLAVDGGEVRINGQPLDTGIRVLADRDEIQVRHSDSFYFSIETLASVKAFEGAAHPVFCPRCKLEIAAGEQSVKCPQCQVTYHQKTELECWTYAETCALCSQQTDLNQGFSWSPVNL